ncbi:hypothetical protein [Clostridium sp. C105KSO13]|nr:hypothetical protein [Clostridium sp. C105KSO13]
MYALYFLRFSPIPWRARKAISAPMEVDRPHSSEAAASEFHS